MPPSPKKTPDLISEAFEAVGDLVSGRIFDGFEAAPEKPETPTTNTETNDGSEERPAPKPRQRSSGNTADLNGIFDETGGKRSRSRERAEAAASAKARAADEGGGGGEGEGSGS